MGQFNLIDEKWIRILNLFGEEHLVSIHDVFQNAAEYKMLANENAMCDLVIFRVLLAILYRSTFYQNDSFYDISDLDDFWRDTWNKKSFDMNQIALYLSDFHDRFYLIDDEHPFLQITKQDLPEMMPYLKGAGKKIEDCNFYGLDAFCMDALESDNSISESTAVKGKERANMSTDLIARTLLFHALAEDCNLTKGYPKETYDRNALHSWLSKTVSAVVEGRNLFETLMMNLVLYDPRGGKSFWDEDVLPMWEWDRIDYLHRQFPNMRNPVAFWTIPSTYILLNWKDGKLVGYTGCRGQCVSMNDLSEVPADTMAIWAVRTQGEKDASSVVQITAMSPSSYCSQYDWFYVGSLACMQKSGSISVKESETRKTVGTPIVMDWLRNYSDVFHSVINVRLIYLIFDPKGYVVYAVKDSSLGVYSDLIFDKAVIKDKDGATVYLTDMFAAFASNLQFVGINLYILDQCFGNMKREPKKPPFKNLITTTVASDFYEAIDPIIRDWLVQNHEGYSLERLNAVKDLIFQEAQKQMRQIRDRHGDTVFRTDPIKDFPGQIWNKYFHNIKDDIYK